MSHPAQTSHCFKGVRLRQAGPSFVLMVGIIAPTS
jgi:hypothetical protein